MWLQTAVHWARNALGAPSAREVGPVPPAHTGVRASGALFAEEMRRGTPAAYTKTPCLITAHASAMMNNCIYHLCISRSRFELLKGLHAQTDGVSVHAIRQ
jgi:hypothetical protein